MPKKRIKVGVKRKYHYKKTSYQAERDEPSQSEEDQVQCNKMEVIDQRDIPSVAVQLESVAVPSESMELNPICTQSIPVPTKDILTHKFEQACDHTYTKVSKDLEKSSGFVRERVSYENNIETDGVGVEFVEGQVPDVDIENETVTVQSEFVEGQVEDDKVTIENVSETFTSQTESFSIFATGIRYCARLRNYSLRETEDDITMIKFYGGDYLAVMYTVRFDSDFKCSVHVHRKEIVKSHTLWQDMPPRFTQLYSAVSLLDRLKSMTVCCGNPEVEYQSLVSIGSALTSNTDSEILAYREGDFGAKSEIGDRYISTIRSSKCEMLTFRNLKCVACVNYGYALKKRIKRIEERRRNGKTFINSTFKHKDMTRDELCQKLFEQKEQIDELQQNVFKLERQYNAAMLANGMKVE